MAKSLPLETGTYGRGDVFNLDPDDVHIPPKGDPLYDPPRVNPSHPETVKAFHKLERLIRKFGVRQSIEVVERDGKIWVVDGRQRLTIARKVKQDQLASGTDETIRVPCLYKKQTEATSQSIIVAANTHVPETDASILDKIEQRLGYGRSEQEIAEAFGEDIEWVQTRVKVLSLAEPVLDLVKDGKMSITAAVRLCGIPREEQIKQAEEMVALGTATVAETLRRVRQVKTGDAGPTPRKPKKVKEAKAVLALWLSPGGEKHRKRLPDGMKREELRPYEQVFKWLDGDETETEFTKALDALVDADGAPEEEM